jgi:hypothetical protein
MLLCRACRSFWDRCKYTDFLGDWEGNVSDLRGIFFIYKSTPQTANLKLLTEDLGVTPLVEMGSSPTISWGVSANTD